MESVRFRDALYFLAELVVYVAVVWFGFTRDVPTPVRWILAVGGLVVFAVAWGLFAAPRAPRALHGAADTGFRLLWFGFGLVAAVFVIVHLIAG